MSETYILSNLKNSQPRLNTGFIGFLAVYFVIILLPAYWLDVFETTDARYAEIAREMLASGNYLEPYYNGIKHFHKPPLTYWITALGMQIFGVNGLGARFFCAVFAVLTLIYTRKTAYVLTKDAEKADASVLVLGSSILFLVVSRIISTDIYLTFFTVASLFHLFSQMYEKKTLYNVLMLGIFSGLGFLTKGPIIFLFTLLPFYVSKVFSPEHRNVFSRTEILLGSAVFASFALPWYIYVVSVNDNLLSYFLFDQTVERVASSKFNRSKPFYFMPMIFVVTFVPYIWFFFKNIKSPDFIKPGRVLYLYVLMPFIIFQISSSKLPSYLLPFYPVSAMLIAGRMQSIKLRRHIGWFFVITALLVGCTPFVLEYMKPHAVYITPAAVFMGVSFFAVHYKGFYYSKFLKSTAWSLVALTLLVFCCLAFIGENFKGYRKIAEDIRRFDPHGKYPVVTYDIFAPSLSFYLGDIITAIKGKTRETQFQTHQDVIKVYVDNNAEASEYFAVTDDFIVVTYDKYVEDLLLFSNRNCVEIGRRGYKKPIFFCERKPRPQLPY